MFHRDTWAEINLDNLYHNVASMRKHVSPDAKLFAVVKANAYGHGDYEVAQTALEAGADYLAVAFLDEALALRKKGIDAPILVLGATRPESVNLAADFNIALTVFQQEWVDRAKEVIGKGEFLRLHIKCDTGMGRLGVRTEMELTELENVIRPVPEFMLEGIYTHFATADELDSEYYDKQVKGFNRLLSSLSERPSIVHASNSASALRHPDNDFSAIRMGITMYGLTPSLEIKDSLPIELKQVMSLKTKIVHVKELSGGESISYGAAYTAPGREWVATLPVGYADGWLRKLQGFEVLANGKRVPIVGRICMDQCMVRLPEFMPVGTEVTLIGQAGDKFISMDEIAVKMETINYEVPCIITNRVPRVYLRSGRVKRILNPLLLEENNKLGI
ncbi:alanine racemase [Peribacillus sp. SCS-155]|uniref:alanine racemase n=1 Tax=Peribacillus sedimenti TaxID=3115297 RepID=UPI00390631C2